MAKAFYFDMISCTGCRTCQMACKDKNDLPIGVLFRDESTYEVGIYPKVGVYHFSQTCNHCEKPACMAACAAGAIYQNEEGVVLIDAAVCDGCGTCVTICPYGVPKLLPDKGIAGKCDTCIAIRANGNDPQCVSACPMRALEFGEVDELMAAHPDAVSISEMAIMPDDVTGPRTLVSLKPLAKEMGKAVTL